MSVSQKTKIILAFRSGGVCAFPACGKRLTYSAEIGADAYVGEAAHIAGEKPGAARYDAMMNDTDRNGVDNLIYSCADHHTVIDKVPEDWPTERLQRLKQDHEERVRQVIEDGFADVSFPELRRAIAWVNTQVPVPQGSFDLVTPEQKIQKNGLSIGARHIIAAGLASRKTVHEYVEAEAQLDGDFPERLKSAFLAEYHSLRSRGQTGQELFELMCDFATRGLKAQVDRTAGLAVLVYLFEICDLFEK